MIRNLFGGIPDKAITHGFSQRRSIRSVQIPPEVGKSPTDFADDADFFYSSDDTEFIRRFPAEAITHGFSRRRPVRSVQIPPGIGICPTKKNLCHLWNLWDEIISTKKNLRISVKSVGRNNPPQRKICVYLWNLWDKIIHTKKNLRHLRNLRDKKQ